MKKILALLLMIISLGIFIPNVSASSGTISISSSSTVVVGNTVTVTVTLSSSTALGAWEFDINYDSSYLQLTSSTAEANGTYFVSYASNSSTKSKTYTLKFRALKSGSTNITVGSYDIYDWDGDNMSITRSNKSIKIMTQAELEASYSKDNNLSGITVSVDEEEYELTPEFDSDTLEYSVTVPTGTTLINVEATKSDSTASVAGDGEIEVSEGVNTIPIVVTAQNGDEKTYTLVVNVEDENPIEVTINGNIYTVVKSATLLTGPVTFSETTINIEGFDIPAFVNEDIGYTLVGLKDSDGNIFLYRYLDGEYTYYNELSSKSYMLVPIAFPEELDYIKTTVTINGEEVEAYKYSESSNLYIIYAIDLETNEENYYLYDPDSEAVILFDDSFIQEANKTIEYYTYVIIAFGGALFIMLVLLFTLLHSTKKKQKKINQFIEKQEAKLEATRKLNDVVDEIKAITEDSSSDDPLNEEEEKSTQEETEVTASIEESNLEESEAKPEEEQPKEEIKKSKKELKKEEKEAKRKAKEKRREEKEEFFKEEVEVEDNNDNLTDDTGVYDIFEDEKKKKKKKK